MVDRTTIDSWLRAWSLHDSTASVNLFSNSSIFPSLDPRYDTYPQQTAISTAYSKTGPGTWQVPLVNPTNPFSSDTSNGRLVQVTSDIGTEIGQISAQVGTTLTLQLTQAHTGVMTIRPLPVPPTVLYWTQLK